MPPRLTAETAWPASPSPRSAAVARWRGRAAALPILHGAPVPVFVAGARVLANHPIGPLVATPLNATAMSSDSSLDIGLHIDPAAITEPALLRRRVNEAIRKLLRAAGAA